MPYSPAFSRRVWLGLVRPAALLVAGIGGGLLLQTWRVRSSEGPTSPELAHPSEDGHGAAATGIVEIPVTAQEAGGVSTALAGYRTIQSFVRAHGVVSADRSRITALRPLSGGVVETVLVELGDSLQAGDPVLRYDNAELGLAIGGYLSASADLIRREASLDVQETVLARSLQMLEVGAIAKTEHEIRSARHRDALAQVHAERARRAQFEEQLHRFGLSEQEVASLPTGEGGEVHRSASITTLRSPAAGVVTDLRVNPGERVDGASAVLTITDLSVVWILAEVYEHDLALVRRGDEVAVRVPAFPDRTFSGEVAYISDTLDQDTKAATVRCVVRNPAAMLKVGMFATVEIPGERSSESLAVPSAAIQTTGGRMVVFVKRSRTSFELTPVQTGVEGGGWTAIAEGLALGDEVLTQGSFYAKTATLRDLIGDHH
ncbi:MAG: efflux RND transporter periplasmic adaptor subunit [Bryobacterales bacterium]|nr:efflux RND transporter periplasmic adaptor subunit [Bryobacterales bacterium]